MSKQTPQTRSHGTKEVVPAADAIPDFGDMYARQRSHATWTVLHLKEDADNTVYIVDLQDMTCTCPDHEYRRSDGEACKHMAKAIYHAPEKVTADDQAVLQLSEYVRDVREHAEELERLSTGVRADRAAERHSGASEDSEGDTTTVMDDPVEAVRGWLEDQGVPLSEMKIWEDDDYGSVQIERDGYLQDDDFQALKDATDHEKVKYDGDNNRNYISPDDVREVITS